MKNGNTSQDLLMHQWQQQVDEEPAPSGILGMITGRLACCTTPRKLVPDDMAASSMHRAVRNEASPSLKSPNARRDELAALELIKAFIMYREAGDVERAAACCTNTVQIVTPQGATTDNLTYAKTKVFVQPAPLPSQVLTPLQAKLDDRLTFIRDIKIQFTMFSVSFRQEFALVVEDERAGPRISRIALTKLGQTAGAQRL
jgi:hypothetical protein